MNTRVFLLLADMIIFCKVFFWIRVPVGLFGLQIKIHPLFGILEIKSSVSFSRFIVLKNETLAPLSLAADSYSPKVGIGIKTDVLFDKKA